ncbi:hypothetical protein QQX98_000014 [Neonectria punicea]|uniref:Uncharacterized protein n=1 Tax=Neonectria punicea TaxID=979145 RepID=A0ABR1HV49_9HYPO
MTPTRTREPSSSSYDEPSSELPNSPAPADSEPDSPEVSEPTPKKRKTGKPAKSEKKSEPRGKNKLPPGKVGSLKYNKLLSHQQKMHSALDEMLFDVADRMQSRLKTRKKPLELSDMDDIIGRDNGEEDGMQDQWNDSAEKRDLKGSHLNYMMGIWKVSLRVFCCSPLAIISPLRGLVHQPTPSRHPTTPSSIWGQNFCTTLGILMTHGVWESRPSLLITVLQFAVICRTDDRRIWNMPAGPKCSTLKRLNDALQKAKLQTPNGELQHSVQDMHRAARADERNDEGTTSPISNIMRQIAVSTKSDEHQSQTATTKCQGLDVYGLTNTDLYNVQCTIDTFTSGVYPTLMPTRVAHQGFLDSRGGNDIPVGVAQLEEFYRRSWMDEQRAIVDHKARASALQSQL